MPAVPLITDVVISTQLLGRGRFSSVRRAKQQGVDVAAKEYNFACAKHPSDHLARVLCSKLADIVELCHPHLLAILGVYQPQFNQPVIISPMMELGSVRTRIEASGAPPLSFRDALNINLGLLRGLRFLHEQRCAIVHCRLSDHNVLLDGDGSAKIADYGMSSFLATAFPDDVHCGDIVAFLPPEVLAKRHVPSVKADVFAVGVVLMECVLGSVPANGDSLDQQTATRRRMADLHRLHTSEIKGSGLPELVQRCFEPQPQKRPTCMQLEDDLQALCVSTDYMWSEQRLLKKTTVEQSDYSVPRQNAPLAVLPKTAAPSQWAEFEQLGTDAPRGRSNTTAMADLHGLSVHMSSIAVSSTPARSSAAGASTSSGHADLNTVSAEIHHAIAQGRYDTHYQAKEEGDGNASADHYSIISSVPLPPETAPTHVHVPATSATQGYINVTTASRQSQPEGLYSYNALQSPSDVPSGQSNATVASSTTTVAEGHYNVPTSADRHPDRHPGPEGHYSYNALAPPTDVHGSQQQVTAVAPATCTVPDDGSQQQVTAVAPATSTVPDGHYNVPSPVDRPAEDNNSAMASQDAVTSHTAASASPEISSWPRSYVPEGHYNIPSSRSISNLQSSAAASNAVQNGSYDAPATTETDGPAVEPSPPNATNQLDGQFNAEVPGNHYNVPSSLAARESSGHYVTLPGVTQLTGLDLEPSTPGLGDSSITSSAEGPRRNSSLSPTNPFSPSNPFYTSAATADSSDLSNSNVDMSGSYMQWPSNRPVSSARSPSSQPASHAQLGDQDSSSSSTRSLAAGGEAANPFDSAPSYVSTGSTPATLALGNNSPTMAQKSPASGPTSPRSVQLTMVNSTEPDSSGSKQGRKTLTSFLPKAKPRQSKRLSDSGELQRSATLETSHRRHTSALTNVYSPIPRSPTSTPAVAKEPAPCSSLNFDQGATNGPDVRARSFSQAQADTRPPSAVRRHQFDQSLTGDSVSNDHLFSHVPARRSTMTNASDSLTAQNTGFHTIHRSVGASTAGNSQMERNTTQFSQTLDHRELRRQTLSGQPSRPQRRMSASVNAMPYYYKNMSREQAEDLLSPKSVGTFLLRDGSAHGGAFSISLRVADRCKHFRTIIDELGHYRVPGWPVGHASMASLVTYHMKHPISECDADILTVPCRKQ